VRRRGTSRPAVQGTQIALWRKNGRWPKGVEAVRLPACSAPVQSANTDNGKLASAAGLDLPVWRNWKPTYVRVTPWKYGERPMELRTKGKKSLGTYGKPARYLHPPEFYMVSGIWPLPKYDGLASTEQTPGALNSPGQTGNRCLPWALAPATRS